MTPATQSGDAAGIEAEEKRKHREPFEYVGYWDNRPVRADEITGYRNGQPLYEGIERILSCANCAYEAHKAGRLVQRVVKFPRGPRVCQNCSKSLKRPLLDPDFSARDHAREKAMLSASNSNASSQSSPI